MYQPLQLYINMLEGNTRHPRCHEQI